MLDDSYYSSICLLPARDLSAGDFTIGVIGPGTGLGAAGLMGRDGRTFPLITEAGHVGFAPENALQRSVWEVFRYRFERVSDERLVSGSGLENIFTALAEIHNELTPALGAADIFNLVGSSKLATASVNLFFEMLGQVAGNFPLTLGAYDGIYIVQRYPSLLANSAFRTSFENKGHHRHIMEQIPTLLIQHPYPGLMGTAAVFREMAT